MSTLSGLQLEATCPGSAALPRIGHINKAADIGSALHEYNAVLGERGRGAADAEAHDIAERWKLEGKDRARFFSRARAFNPQIPEGALYEVPLCLRADGTVEPVKGGHGEYNAPADAIVCGTLDIVFAEPRQLASGRCPDRSVLWAPDLKTGADAYVAPIDKNLQARASALLGSRFFGADFVVPAILFLEPGGGRWDMPLDGAGNPRPLREDELAAIERDLRAHAVRAAEQVERVRAGKLPKLVTGAHCTYCPARPGCPAHVSEARALATGEAGLVPGPLTHEQAVRGAGMLGPIKAATTALDKALKTYVGEHGPIHLPDGRVFEPQEGVDIGFNVRALYQALRDELDPLVGETEGARIADLAFKATRGGIFDSIREAHEKVGFKGKMTKAFERIAAKEGVCREVPTVTWSAHYPKTGASK